MTRMFVSISAGLMLGLAACDGGTDGSTDPTPVDSDVSATFDDVQAIFTASCATSGCHDGAIAPDLATNTYDNIVGVASNASLNYVEAGSRADSYLYHKVAGTQADVGGFGNQMPIGTSLSDADIEVIGAWIDAGALP